MDHYPLIAAERRALADLLDTLTPEQLATPSLAGAWTVQEVFGHLTVPFTVTMPGFALAMAKARGRFDVANDRLARTAATAGPAALARLLRDHAEHRFVPPGGTSVFPLTDLLVHGQDIRRPLRIARTVDAAAAREALDFLVSPAAARGFVPARRVEGLRFEATDLAWAGGDPTGTLVTGPVEALLCALTGRAVAVADLGGPGQPTLASRMR